jgi:predicted PurR-regulated permease PerM
VKADSTAERSRRAHRARAWPRPGAAEESARVRSPHPPRAFATAFRASLGVALAGLLAFVVYLGWPVLQPLIVATVLATTMWPWISRIAAWRIWPGDRRVRRALAALLVYAATFGVAGVLVWITVREALPYVDKLLAAYPDQTAPINAFLEPFRQGDLAGGAQKVAEGVASSAVNGATAAAPRPAAAGPRPLDPWALATGLFGGAVTLAMVLIFTFFLILDGARFAGWLLLLLPRERRVWARALGVRVRDRVSQWVLGQMAYALLSSAMVGGVLWALGIPEPGIFAIGAGLLSLIPGVGPWFATIPAFVIALGMSTWQAVGVAAFGLSLWAADATVIAPRIYGAALRLPSFVVLFSIMFGAAVMGTWGALIATPVAAALDAVLRDRLRPPAP